MLTKQQVPLFVSKMQREIDGARGIEQTRKGQVQECGGDMETKTGKYRNLESGPYPILFRQKYSTVMGFRNFC